MSRSPSLLGPFALALACVGAPALAHAQETGHEPPSEAMQLFDTARQAYREGRYAEAAEELERALVLDPSAPTLLYNLGRVAELMGNYERAISAYERYVTLLPATATDERERTEGTLARLRGAREHAAPPPTVEVVGSMDEGGPTFVRERGVADDAFWGTLIAGAVATVAGASLGVSALVLRSQADEFVFGRDGTVEDRDARLALAQGLGLGADVSGGVGVAGLVTAVGLFVLRERSYEVWPEGAGRVAVLPSVGPDRAALALRGTF